VLVGLIWVTLAGSAFVTEAPIRNEADLLVWGGDKTGGAPFIMTKADGSLDGFDADLAAYLGEELGLRTEFSQGKWDQTLPRLYRGDIDIALNGFEFTPEREQVWRSTIPYYVYDLQLLVRKDGPIQSWKDLLTPNPDGSLKTVGVLSNSSAHEYLNELNKDGTKVEIAPYSEGVTSAMSLVEKGTLDATLQDTPAYAWYVLRESDNQFKNLRAVGEPVGEGYYVIYVDRDDTEFLAKLNAALRKAITTGKLKEIFSRYNLWNNAQAKLQEIKPENWPEKVEQEAGETAEADTNWLAQVGDDFLLLLRAAWTTVLLACVSMPLAIVIGLAVAVGRLYGPTWLGWILRGYVELIRGTPLLMQLWVIYFFLPAVQDMMGVPIEMRLPLPAFWAGVIGLAINYSAYEAENYRAGLMAIPKGQMEAALALGMTRGTALRQVVVPQAVKLVIPPVTNDFIALFKDTSVCSVIAVVDLTGKATELFNNDPSLVFRIGILTPLLYLAMSYPLSMLARRLEKKFPRVVV
jgi:polar amino acid transport system substrate-binding protein